MKTRFVYALTLAIVLCAFAVAPAFAGYDEPFAKWDDPGNDTSFPHEAGGFSYVQNGAFDDWAGGKPVGWNFTPDAWRDELHWAKIDWADVNSRHAGIHNYGLGLLASGNQGWVPGYGIAYSQLNVPASGTYWVVVHATAWGMAFNHTSEAWYAIYPTSDPEAVPASAWRELYPDSRVCTNASEMCNYLGRAESVYIGKGSYIFLRGEMKFADMKAWTVWGFDDIGVWDMEPGTEWPFEEDGEPVLGWLIDGVVTWDGNVPR